MFYFIPFQLKSDVEKKINPPMLQVGSFGEVVMYVVVGLMLAALFGVFIVLPTIMAMQASVPAG
jgi:hypothetical protein